MRTIFNKFSAAPCRNGFTLVEVMVASVVFMLAASAAMAGIASMQSIINNASRLRDASVIMNTVAARLIASGQNICPGAYGDAFDLLADNDIGAPTAAELACFGADSVATGTCVPDYPRLPSPDPVVNDLTRIFGQTIDGAIVNPVWRVDAAGGGVPVLNYKGFRYRVTWNIACDMPAIGSKTVQVNVGWEPFATAIQEGRFVYNNFIKTEGL